MNGWIDEQSVDRRGSTGVGSKGGKLPLLQVRVRNEIHDSFPLPPLGSDISRGT